MSSKRIFAISVLISLFGHLIVLSAFSLNKVEERKKHLAPLRVSFWGEFPDETGGEPLLTPVKEKEPKLEVAIKELETGPSWHFTKTGASLPNPMTGIEEMASSLIEEAHLLEGERASLKKEVPERKVHLLEK